MEQETKQYETFSLKNKKRLGAALAFAVMVPALIFAWDHAFRHGAGALAEKDGMAMDASGPGTEIATIGDAMEGVRSPGASWAGEVLSLGNLPVQPQREGTLMEWKVRIGDRVKAGQVLATLSAPPSMPDFTRMLAEQASMLAQARAQAETTGDFSRKNNEQLAMLLNAVGKATQDSQAILSSDSTSSSTAKTAVDQAKQAAGTMRQNVRSFLDQAVAAHVRMVSSAASPSVFRAGGLDGMFGQLDAQNQHAYEFALLRLIEELRKPDAVPFDAADRYFVLAVRLANTTLDSADIPDIKAMMRGDQNEYLEMVSKYREMEAEAAMKETEYKLMSVEQEKMYAQDRKMIDEKIAENEKMSAMSQAEAKAAETAYARILQGFTGSLYIVAPRAGTISTIMAKVGQFVEPGMPVASLNSGEQREQFVRFRIPGNVRLPEAGVVLTVMRPGFPQDVKKLRLLGVGTTLDAGTFMADAEFMEPVQWPPDASVRVMAPQSSDAPVIKLLSVWWNEEGVPQVWGVSPAGRLFAKKITIGRTLGTFIEVYDGLKNGDRYIANPESGIHENMLLEDIMPKGGGTGGPAGSGGHTNMPGMDM